MRPLVQSVAAAYHRNDDAREALADKLGAMIPRALHDGSWADAARFAGGEGYVTGRARAYDESTLRQAALRADREGLSQHVQAAVWLQVRRACAGGGAVVAHTDVFDQPYYTKKPAHAGPIGRLGNRLLAATYFGLTTVQLPTGSVLWAHLSWHKPASPLRDALEDLFADPARLRWWRLHVRLHVWDRGGNGDPLLAWAGGLGVLYLTLGRESAELWRFHAPTARTDTGLALSLRSDRRLRGSRARGPWEAIVPAKASDATCTRGLRFRVAAPLTEGDLRGLTDTYKTRWPAMENHLKAAQARGFGRNRTRSLALVVSRGIDGQRTRLQARESHLLATLEAQNEGSGSPATFAAMQKTSGQVLRVQSRRVALEKAAPRKGARPAGGAERLYKWLLLATHNALTLLQQQDASRELREMDLPRLYSLLLGRSATVRVHANELAVYIDPVLAAADRRAQEALLALFNHAKLRCRGRSIVLRLAEDLVEKAA